MYMNMAAGGPAPRQFSPRTTTTLGISSPSPRGVMHSTALPYAAERQRVRAKLRTEGQSGTVPMVVQAISPSPVWRATRRLRVGAAKPAS